MEASLKIPVIESIREIGGRRRIWFVDIWGVMHNGRDAFPMRPWRHGRSAKPAASSSCCRTRRGPVPTCRTSSGNSACRTRPTTPQVSSGDLTRHELAGGRASFISGPERDLPIFDNAGVTLTGPEDADLIVCSGLFDDDVETPDDYVDLLSSLAARKRLMICANPDHKVERGNRLIYCAGALAAAYESPWRRNRLCGQTASASLRTRA